MGTAKSCQVGGKKPFRLTDLVVDRKKQFQNQLGKMPWIPVCGQAAALESTVAPKLYGSLGVAAQGTMQCPVFLWPAGTWGPLGYSFPLRPSNLGSLGVTESARDRGGSPSEDA